MINEFPKDYKQIYRVLGGHMTANNDSNFRKIFSQNNFIYPIIVGTITKNEEYLNFYKNRTLSLSPLTWNGIEKVLKFKFKGESKTRW
jgi:hypothetical protein